MKTPAVETDSPQGGWTYQDPRTGIKFEDFSLTAIFTRVYKAWQGNEIPIPDDWQAVIRHEICEQRPDIECREIGEPERFTTLQDIWRFGESLKRWMDGGAQWVPQEEADRRADICIGCHENKPINGCLGCKEALRWLSQRIGMPRARKDAELHSCRVCGCLNRIAVHVPVEAMSAEGLTFPKHCWKTKAPSPTVPDQQP